MTGLRRFLVPILALLVFTTCDDLLEDTTGTEDPGPVQVSISQDSWPQSLAIGGMVALEVQVQDAEGQPIADPPLVWTLDTPETGTLDDGSTSTAATLRGTAFGWIRITVSVDVDQERISGSPVTDSILVVLAGVRITAPGADTVLTSLQDTVDVGAAGLDADGSPVAWDSIEWTVTGSGALELLETGDTTLRLRAVAAGEDTVRARAPGACPGGTCEGRVVIGVAQEAASVTVSPSTVTVETDSTTQLTAAAYDARGAEITGAAFAWRSADSSIATVSTDGLVTGVAEGETTIIAGASGAVEGTAAVTVTPGRGTVEGIVYRDDDGSGTFDAGTDSPLPSATIELVRGTDAAGDVTAETTTDLDGGYTFAEVTADSYVVVITPPAGTTIDPATRAIEVVEKQTTTADFTFTGAPVGPVADARSAALDALVAIEGVATSATTGEGTFADSVFYIQDGTAGIAVLMPPAAFPGGPPAVALEDSVRVLGVRQEAADQRVWIVAESVTTLGTGRADTLDASGVDIDNLRWPSRLIRVRNAIVDSVTGVGNEYVWARDMETLGGVGFLIRLNDPAGLDGTTAFVTGRAYTITGVLTRHDTAHQIEPRIPADIESGLMPLTSVAIARYVGDGSWLSVAGVVSAGTDVYGAQEFYLQDETAGIRVFLPVDSFPDGLPTVAVGDSVRIQGARRTVNGEIDLMASYVSVEGTPGAPSPVEISPEEINAGTGQGELREVYQVQVDSITGLNGEYVWASDTFTSEDLLVYLDADIGVAGAEAFTVGGSYDITGIVSRDLTHFQLKPRGAADIQELAAP